MMQMPLFVEGKETGVILGSRERRSTLNLLRFRDFLILEKTKKESNG